MREIYLDHAATTPLAPEVLEAMLPYYGERFGNASSVHRRGEAARDAVASARSRVAALIGATPEEIVFTATGSEANNLALVGALESAPAGRRRLVVSAIEHPSVLETARVLETRGIPLTVVPVDHHGRIDLEALTRALGPDVALVSVMHVNNEVGTVQPVAEIARLAHAHGAWVHTDAVQAVGKLPVDVAATGVDLLSLAGHKFHGPQGGAALFVRRRLRIAPLVHGGHQERSRRAGTEDLPAIVGLGAAATLAAGRLGEEASRISRLAERLWQGIDGRIQKVRRNGDAGNGGTGILNVCFEGVDGEAVLHELDLASITVSTGSACSAASRGPSHVLLAMGLSAEDAHASVRLSLGTVNTDEDVEAVLEVLPGVVARLRALASPALERSA
ncbi:MAG: cysteine desulfurase family protein [Candidatus Eisenbacteria bacterium]